MQIYISRGEAYGVHQNEKKSDKKSDSYAGLSWYKIQQKGLKIAKFLGFTDFKSPSRYIYLTP